jgi:hypothetical protein
MQHGHEDMFPTAEEDDMSPQPGSLCRVATYDPYEDAVLPHGLGWHCPPQPLIALLPMNPCLVCAPCITPGLHSPPHLQRTKTYDPFEDEGVWQFYNSGNSAGCSTCGSDTGSDAPDSPDEEECHGFSGARWKPTVLERWIEIEAQYDEDADPFFLKIVS